MWVINRQSGWELISHFFSCRKDGMKGVHVMALREWMY